MTPEPILPEVIPLSRDTIRAVLDGDELAKQKLREAVERLTCACVHHDAHECASIRDRMSGAPEDDDSHRRACECCCHENTEEGQDE